MLTTVEHSTLPFTFLGQFGVDVAVTSRHNKWGEMSQIPGVSWKKGLVALLDVSPGKEEKITFIFIENHCRKRRLKLNADVYDCKSLGGQTGLFITHKDKINGVVNNGELVKSGNQRAGILNGLFRYGKHHWPG